MVDYVINTYNGDPARVFVTGSSSGCMMTNLISGVYPAWKMSRLHPVEALKGVAR